METKKIIKIKKIGNGNENIKKSINKTNGSADDNNSIANKEKIIEKDSSNIKDKISRETKLETEENAVADSHTQDYEERSVYTTLHSKPNPPLLQINKLVNNLNQEDLFLVIDALIDLKGLVSHHLESANNFYTNGIKQIITQGFKIEKNILNRRSATAEDKDIEWIHCEVIPTNVTLKPPTTLHYKTGKEIVLYPKVALAREKIYSGTLFISCDVKATAHLKNGSTLERTDTVKNFRISKIPIIKGSVVCNTYGKSKEALMQMGEDPSDPGGYFLVKGEWAVDCTENITFNQPKIYINEGYGKSRCRCEFISKPGDSYQNSDMLLIKYFNDETLTFEFSRNELNGVQIPFFLLFRALGWASSKDMMDWIIYDYDDDANKELLNNVKMATNAKYGKINYKDIYNQYDALKLIVDIIPEEQFKNYDLKNKPENYHNAITNILSTFDVHCLPHIGMTSESRYDKLKFLALLVRKTILVWLKHIPQTDRDSFKNKRIHSAGENYAKTLKQLFNQTFVMPIKRRMFKDFNNTSFSQVNMANMVKAAIFAEDFERLIVQTIISGNKSNLKIKKKNMVNRLQTQLLNRKNQLNMLATMRQITAPSAENAKQSERASEMRRVHMSQIGFVCVNHSPPEGEKVGINKQLAISAIIAPSSSSEVLKKKLLEDKDIIPEAKLTPLVISRGNYGRIFVNGHLIGYIENIDNKKRNTVAFVDKYRKKRRLLEINPHTTIYWDMPQNEVQFFVDVGRLSRPLMIVYNNRRNPENFPPEDRKESAPYKQCIAITSEDIQMLYRRKKTLEDLLYEQKIEFISPEEQENCLLAASYRKLVSEASNEDIEYTHCDIPQAQIGVTAFGVPFANHNQAPRITYQTSQAKQTCGYYCLNWPDRMDKETSLQYINEKPLICTVGNKYIFPNGCNVMVAMMSNTGYNQEDSLIVNKAAVERGLFNVSKMTFYKTEFEQKEELGNPDASKTDGLKSANYEKLVNGVVRKGDKIRNDDVIIGRYMPMPKGKDDKYIYTDRSIVYKEDEEAIVHNVIVDQIRSKLIVII